MPLNDPLSTPEAARLLGVSKRTVQVWISKGQLPAIQFPGVTGAFIIEREAVMTLLAERTALLEQAS